MSLGGTGGEIALLSNAIGCEGQYILFTFLYYLISLLEFQYLHDMGITHRDLKPENILLANDIGETLLKVTDFGLSKFVDSSSMLKTFCGKEVITYFFI